LRTVSENRERWLSAVLPIRVESSQKPAFSRRASRPIVDSSFGSTRPGGTISGILYAKRFQSLLARLKIRRQGHASETTFENGITAGFRNEPRARVHFLKRTFLRQGDKGIISACQQGDHACSARLRLCCASRCSFFLRQAFSDHLPLQQHWFHLFCSCFCW
jgi:hypothetical protein